MEVTCDGGEWQDAACFAYLRREGEFISYNSVKRMQFRLPRNHLDRMACEERDQYVNEWISLANWELNDYEKTQEYHIFDKKLYSMKDRLIWFGFCHIPRGDRENAGSFAAKYVRLRREVEASPDDAFILMNYVDNFGMGHPIIGWGLWIKTLKDWKWQHWIDSIPWDIEYAMGNYEHTMHTCGPWFGLHGDGMQNYYQPPRWGYDKDIYKRLKTSVFFQPLLNAQTARESPVYRPVGD